MDTVYNKRVSDPVYGSCLLSSLELKVIDTPVFQRLRNIKHLGMAHFVYPSASFSRFSHSIGVLGLAGRMLEVLRAKRCLNEMDQEPQYIIKKYRLAALLHDVGHYPFSHCMEEAARDYFNAKKITPEGEQDHEPDLDPAIQKQALPHEQVGRLIVERDPELSALLAKNQIDPSEVADIFAGEKHLPLASLIRSDLDADRIDYLLRSSLHTGLPYGSIDLDYLISEIDFKGGRFVFRERQLKP